MFEFDIFNHPEPVRIFLCKPDDTIVCELNGIVESTAQMKVTLNNQAELTFDYDRYVMNEADGSKIESNGYHSLNVDMQLLVSGFGYFRMKYPPMKWSVSGETKTITAYSAECELEDKDLVAFKINQGTSDSLEYLITYDDDETEELLNAYTGLPYDYIVFDNTYPAQLSELLNKYADGSTITDSESIAEIVDYCSLIPRLKRRTYTETDDDGQTATSLTEYVEYTYEVISDSEGVLATSDTVESIYLFDGFNDRISELITFYTKYHDQLSLIPLAIENCSCNWSVGTIDSSLSNKKYQFDIDGENIYSFLTNDVAETCKCVFQFDLFNRVINITLVENIGVDCGLIVDKENLLNSLEVSCSTDDIITRYRVSGGNDIDILYVNFASYRIENLLFFVYARDENGNRIYMSDALAEKYLQYIEDREVARDYYIAYTKTYNQLLTDIDEIQYRVPNDSLQEDYSTYTYTELENLLTVYNNLLVTLLTLYKEDYGTAGCNSDGSVNEDYLKQTEYWYDYYAYEYTLKQIDAAMDAIVADSSYAEIDDDDVLAVINAYKTEWSLYGIVELQAKIEAYTNSMYVLTDAESVILDDDGAPIAWDNLTSSQQAEYSNLEVNYHYSEYKELYDNKLAAQAYLAELQTELALMEAQQEEAQTNRNAIRNLVTLAGYDRAKLAAIIDLGDSSLDEVTFTTDDIQVITRLYKDSTYTNEYILTTSLDTTVTTVDVEYELLEDAQEQLSIYSQPQIAFSAELDNLMAMPEFKDFDFEVGNYVTVRYYDDYYVTLRLYSMTFNPCIPEDTLSVTFTNYLHSNSERSDLSYILDQVNGNSSSSSSSSSSGSSTSFGDSDDIDITISNTMLSKLLNTEMFGTRVSNIILDTIKANTLTAKYATFDGLAKGVTVIDGRCIQTGVLIAGNYDGTITENSYGTLSYAFNNSEGSIIDLESGSFSLAGGQLLYDADTNTLTFGEDVKLTWNNVTTDDDQSLEDYISSAISGSSVDTSGFLTCSAAGYLLQGGTEITGYYITSPNIVGGDIKIGSSDGIYFHVDSDGDLYANSAEIVGSITATSGYIGSTSSGWVINEKAIYNGTDSTSSTTNGTYIGTDGILQYYDGYKISLIKGALYANSATISGTLTAGVDSQIGPWYVKSTYIYNGKSELDSTSSGVYIGTDGIGLGGSSAAGTLFKVTSGGILTAQEATITGTVYADSGTIGKWSISNAYDGTNTGICYLGSTYRVYLCQGLNSTKDVLVCRDVSGTYTSGEYYPLVLQATGSVTCSNITVTGLPESSGTYTLANGLGRYASILKVNYILPYSDNSVTLLSKTYSSSTATYGSITIGDPTYYCQFGVWAKYITMASSTVTTGSYYGVYAIGTESYSCYCTITGTCQVVGTFISPTDSSDERLKTDWISVDRYDQFFDLLQPKGFKYLYGSSNLTDRYHLGFGAQTVKAALEECGLTEDDFGGLNTHEVPEGTSGYHGYDEEYTLTYTEFIALLVDQVQKLKTRVSSLENKILALES